MCRQISEGEKVKDYRLCIHFLKSRSRYATLFELKPTDYEGWAKGLKKAGYATNPKYADLLIKIIEDFQLHKLDTETDYRFTASNSLSSDYNTTGSNDNHYSKNEREPSSGKEEYSKATRYSEKSKQKRKEPRNGVVDPFSESREVMKNNGVPYVLAKKGDSYEKIAKEYEMMPWLLNKYNDAAKDATLKEGQLIYIKPKLRSTGEEFYIVKEGDSMQSISQQLGIKLKLLYKRNNIEKGKEVIVGQKLWLNKKKPC